MATAIRPLNKEEFRARYTGQKPHFEYWFGEAIQKTMPTWLHGLLQGILVEALRRAGYKAGSEVELRVDPDWEPVPDVIATLGAIERPYPTKPVEIVAEVLSPDDRMVLVLQKCRHYARIGVERVFVLDPENRDGWEWNGLAQRLEHVQDMKLPNGRVIALAEVWEEMSRELA
jgi:Uma2 family endonuclease